MPKSGQPQFPIRLRSYEVQYPDFAPVFHWLIRNAQLSSKEIAAAFGISDARVRKICQRHPLRREVGPLLAQLDGVEATLTHRPLIVAPPAELRSELGISGEPDFVVLSKREVADLGNLEEQIDRECAEFVASGRIEAGLARMRWYIKRLGRPQSTFRIRILARLRHHSAWLLIHMGRTRSAIDQLRRSMALSAIVQRESRDWIHFRRMAETGLALSMAYAMRNHPERSLSVLKMIRHIHSVDGSDPGAEYHRQMGTALLLLGHDTEAEREFVAAGAKMHQAGMAPAMVQLLGRRQMNLLNRPNWDGAMETVSSAKAILSPYEIAYQTNVHWAVITGLASGDRRIMEAALELLGPTPPVFYGHQATIRHLLEVTPRLCLSGIVLKRWTRYMMYANLYQDE